jgi:hypothetical protein
VRVFLFLILLLTITKPIYSQCPTGYPYEYGFDTDENCWTITDPGSDYGWEAPGYLCFNRAGNYVDGGLHQWTSPVEDHTGVDSIRVTFRIIYSVRVGGAADRVHFCYNDGGWNCQIIGNGAWFIDLPNTTTQFRIELNAIGNGSLGGKYVHLDYLNIEQWNGGVLPIELATWSGKAYDNKVVLKWVTASEINNDKFEVYWSENGETNWELIDTKNGAGNSNIFIEYHSIHETSSEYNYYKLRQIDFDGEWEEFNIIVVHIPNDIIKDKDYIYINPLGQQVNENYRGIKYKKEINK